MIKVIHYCWFGNGEIPEKDRMCIESWKKFFPGFEIKRWDESNFNVNICLYTKQAYEQKKWAFVSDFARIYILYNYGGLYFDTDVKILKSFDDILERGPFLGREKEAPLIGVNPGIGMYAEKKMPFLKEILDSYLNSSFLDQYGLHNYYNIVDRFSDHLISKGLTPCDDIQNVAGFAIYPKEYFCPMDYHSGVIRKSDKTHSIHLYHESWIDERTKHRKKVAAKIKKALPGKSGVFISKFYVKVSNLAILCKNGNYGAIMGKIKSKLLREREKNE